ncbi:hypothetical protein JTB14_033771 [Gonioctena quinquepunctata]|nr:hypothetical protein JTB14_033771 [Gonioctena quinquepunctata]
MNWEDFKRIIDKLEDISKQDVLETSLNNMTIPAEKQQTCNCSCKNNTGLQNPPRSNLNPNFRQTGIPSAPRQPLNKFHQNHNTNYFPQRQNSYTTPRYQNIHRSNSAQRTPTQSYPPRNQNCIPNTRTNEGIPKCQICNRIGHYALTCYKNNHPNGRRLSKPHQPSHTLFFNSTQTNLPVETQPKKPLVKANTSIKSEKEAQEQNYGPNRNVAQVDFTTFINSNQNFEEQAHNRSHHSPIWVVRPVLYDSA